jgi:hypothetical protein
MAYGDQRFRHDLRNTLNSFGLAIRAMDVSDDDERVELLDLIVNSADEAIAIIENNPPEDDSPPQAPH